MCCVVVAPVWRAGLCGAVSTSACCLFRPLSPVYFLLIVSSSTKRVVDSNRQSHRTDSTLCPPTLFVLAGLVDPEGTLVDPRTFLGYTTQQLYYKVLDDPFLTVMTTSTAPPSSSSSSPMVASTTSATASVPTPSQAIQTVPAPQAIEKPKKPTFSQSLDPQIASYFIAGGCAGAASRTVVSPLERLKIIQYVL